MVCGSHGAPSLAVEDDSYAMFLEGLGSQEQPRAIVLFSAHWESETQQVSMVHEYETIHDFGGFGKALHQMQYPAKGAPELAQEIIDRLTAADVQAEGNEKRGLDHGAWVVLSRLWPQAHIPVIAMSVDPDLLPAEQLRIGRVLSYLREQNVIIIGSGGTSHNLMQLDPNAIEDTAWAVAFENWLEDRLTSWDIEGLIRYTQDAPHSARAVPEHGREHFVPLFYAMGAAGEDADASLLYRDFQYGTLSRKVWEFNKRT